MGGGRRLVPIICSGVLGEGQWVDVLLLLRRLICVPTARFGSPIIGLYSPVRAGRLAVARDSLDLLSRKVKSGLGSCCF